MNVGTYVRFDMEGEQLLVIGSPLTLQFSVEGHKVTVNGDRDISYGFIREMEVSYDIAYAMEQALKDVPFQVICPQNEEYQKAVDGVSAEDIVGEK